MSSRATGDATVPLRRTSAGTVPNEGDRSASRSRNSATPHQSFWSAQRHVSSVELTILMPCLNEARDGRPLRRQGARLPRARAASTARCWSPTTASTDGSQAIARRLRRARGRRRPSAATAPRCGAASRRRAAATSSWATPTTATTSRASSRSSSSCARAHDLVMGNRFQGGIAPGAMPLAAPLPRQPGAELRRPAVLPRAGRRLPLRPARLRPRRRRAARPAHAGHGVRQRDGRQGGARRLTIAEVPTTLRPTAAAARRTCAAGATAGGTCASCCCSPRAGCSCYPGWCCSASGRAGAAPLCR